MLDRTAPDNLDAILDRAEAAQGTSQIYTDATTIARLAALDNFTYGRQRKEEAKALRISVAALDQEVQAHRRAKRMQAITTSSRLWFRECQFTQQGEVRSNLANALVAFRSDPRVARIARFDEMLRLPILMQPVPGAQIEGNGEFQPRPIRDEDYTLLQEWLQREGLEAVSKDTIRQTVDAHAREVSFHPVCQWLDSLEWDGKARLAEWLSKYLGAANNDYTKGIGPMFIISMIARVRKPGCKCDYMPVFEGDQGTFKSSACAILGGEWFSDSLPDIRSGKDVSQHLNGKWLIEVAEMSALDKAEAAALKAFITRPVERYRRSYGHAEVIEPRQCVFVGTTNKTSYLRDETGGRRFWPIAVGKIDTEALTLDRAQLFAEADYYFSVGTQWWPDKAFEAQHIATEQSTRYEADAWEDAICEWLDGLHDDPTRFSWRGEQLITPVCTVLMVARLALSIDAQKIGTSDQRRIIAAMQRLGWEKATRTASGQPYVPGPVALARQRDRLETLRKKAAEVSRE